MRAEGRGWCEVARWLNRTGIPTPTGDGRWWHSSAKNHLHNRQWAAYMAGHRAAHR